MFFHFVHDLPLLIILHLEGCIKSLGLLGDVLVVERGFEKRRVMLKGDMEEFSNWILKTLGVKTLYRVLSKTR